MNNYHKGKIQKRYWAILNGTPHLHEGIIDIPLSEAASMGRYRMTVRPDYAESDIISNKPNYKGAVLKAVTEYSVLKMKGNAAMIEARPATGIKHQIRAHFGLGLNTPILGDHKYSCIKDIQKPQRIHGDILQKLDVRRSRSRDLPMCLHAKKILIPDVVEGKHICIDCNLPHFFVKIMKKLGLKPDSRIY